MWRARHQTHNTKNRRVPTLHTDNGGKGTFCLQSVKNGSDSEHQFVALHADEAVPYGKIVEILDLGTKAGLKVVLATKPSSSSANEAPEQDVTQPAASATDAATPPNQ